MTFHCMASLFMPLHFTMHFTMHHCLLCPLWGYAEEQVVG